MQIKLLTDRGLVINREIRRGVTVMIREGSFADGLFPGILRDF